MRVRPVLQLESEMPFAHETRRVAVLLEERGKRCPVRGEDEPGVGWRGAEGPLDAPALLILSGDEPRACWRAIGAVCIRVGETHALACEPVEVRRMRVFHSVAADVAVPHVVHEDENDVRLVGRRRCADLSASVERRRD